MPLAELGGMESVVVTGASSGVGRAVARAFGARGAHVGLIARNEQALQTCADEIRAAGGEALVCLADVSDAGAVDAAADRIERELGPISTWVNVAMVTVLAPVHETTAAEYRRVTEVTYLGYVHGTLSALRLMRPRNRGTIVQVGSALAYRSIPLQSAYCAAKAAIRGFTDSLRSELIHDGSGIRLTHVHLPAVNTPQSERQRNKMKRQQQPVPPLFSPESVAEQVLWAAEHAPRELFVGGPTRNAVWGQKFLAGVLDRYLANAAWDPQFIDVPNEQTQDILFDTIGGDPGAHGPYRDRERGADLQMRLHLTPGRLAGAAGVLLAAAAAAALLVSRSIGDGGNAAMVPEPR